MKDLVTKPHAILSVENPAVNPQKPVSHEVAREVLKRAGDGKVLELQGHYGRPERSLMVVDPTEQQLAMVRKMAYASGQESHIESDGRSHKMYFSNGPHSGKIVMGQGTEFPEKPDDYYSTLPSGEHFRHNFDFEKMAEGVPHPVSRPWHETYPEGDDEGEGFGKAEHPHLVAHGPKPQENEQAGGNKSGFFHDVMGQFGSITPGKKTNLKFYHGMENFEPQINQHLKESGYTPYLAGGKHPKPDLASKNYNTGHLMVYDPSEGSGGDFGNEQFTSAWRKIHEKAHADTYPQINAKYGEGRRLGKLGVRSPREMKRAIEWEWHTAHRQRDLMEQMGHKMSDEDFNRELNTVMGDATHRAVTGQFTDPHEMGFYPHAHKVPLEHALGIVDAHAKRLGLRHDDDTFARQREEAANLGKSEALEKGARGDWKKEGYTIKYKALPHNEHQVTAHTREGEMVGSARLSEHGHMELAAGNVNVHPKHRRKGLASAMYSHAEKKTGKKMISAEEVASRDRGWDAEETSSSDAKKLWSQKKRPFGKSEDLKKDAKGIYAKQLRSNLTSAKNTGIHHYGKIDGVHVFHATHPDHANAIGMHIHDPSDHELSNKIEEAQNHGHGSIIIHGQAPESLRQKAPKQIGGNKKFIDFNKSEKSYSGKHVAEHWSRVETGKPHRSDISDKEEMLSNHHSGDWKKIKIPTDRIHQHHSGHDASKEYVEEDKKKKLSGSPFPAVIAKPHPEKPGHFKTIDGMHRVSAAKELGESHIEAYVPSDKIQKSESDDEKYDREQRESWKKYYDSLSYHGKKQAVLNRQGPDTAEKRRARESSKTNLQDKIKRMDELFAKKPVKKADHTDKIPGGLADKKKPSQFDQQSLLEGVRVELEHTNDRGIAQEIAMDHLTEDSNYYKKLKVMESKKSGLQKSKNVREQRAAVFGRDPNAPRLSPKRVKMMQRIRDFAQQQYGADLQTAQGKRDPSGELREQPDKAHEPYDVFTPQGVSEEKKRLDYLKQRGIKRVDPKPHWHGDVLETQPSPDAAVHELAHVNLAPEGVSAQQFQEQMDEAYGRHGQEYGHAQGKRTAWEVQPMAVENGIRRMLGLPANKTTKTPMSPEQLATFNVGRRKKELPELQTDPDTGVELTWDTQEPRFHRAKDPSGEEAFYDRSSHIQNPETRERMSQIKEGSLKFSPKKGWQKVLSTHALINLRGRGQGDEAKRRLLERRSQKPEKLAASESMAKMSRPTIRFPHLGVDTRPDSNVRMVETPRQKKIYGRVTAQDIRDKKNVPHNEMIQKPGPDGSFTWEKGPTTHRDLSRQSERTLRGNRVSRKLGTTAYGLSVPTKTSQSHEAAIAGKMVPDSRHQNAVRESVKSWNERATIYNEAIKSWRKKAEEITKLPEGEQKAALIQQHLDAKPPLPKKEKLAKPRPIATKDLPQDEMTQRGRQVESTVEHEATHRIFHQIEMRHGKQFATKIKSDMLDMMSPMLRDKIQGYTKRLKYKPKSESFTEEMLTTSRDILVNPLKRKSFERFIGNDAEGQHHIKELKQAWNKITQYARSVKAPNHIDAESAVPRKLAASEMGKSVPSKRFATRYAKEPSKHVPLTRLKQLQADGWHNPDTGTEINQESGDKRVTELRSKQAEKQADKWAKQWNKSELFSSLRQNSLVKAIVNIVKSKKLQSY